MGQVLKSWQDLQKALSEARQKGGPKASPDANSKTHRARKVVFTNGCFDILHVGHVRYLQEAKAQGDLLVVGLNTDESVRKLKGPTRPLQNENARAEIMAALGAVDFVTLFNEDTPLELIQAIRPDVLVKGGDYKIETIVGAPFVMSYGGEVKALQFVSGVSTTSIVNKMTKN